MSYSPGPKFSGSASVEEHGQRREADLVLGLFDVSVLVAFVGRCPLDLDALFLAKAQQAVRVELAVSTDVLGLAVGSEDGTEAGRLSARSSACKGLHKQAASGQVLSRHVGHLISAAGHGDGRVVNGDHVELPEAGGGGRRSREGSALGHTAGVALVVARRICHLDAVLPGSCEETAAANVAEDLVQSLKRGAP